MCQAPTSGSKRGLLHRNPVIQYLTTSHEKIKSQNKSTEVLEYLLSYSSQSAPDLTSNENLSVLRQYREEICPFAVTPDTDSYYAFIFVFKISIVSLSWHALQPWTNIAVCVDATLNQHSSLAQPAKDLWNEINSILFCFKGTQQQSVSLFMEGCK